jgi:hypothetical protein
MQEANIVVAEVRQCRRSPVSELAETFDRVNLGSDLQHRRLRRSRSPRQRQAEA